MKEMFKESEIPLLEHSFMLFVIDQLAYDLQYFGYSHEEFFIENTILPNKKYYTITHIGCHLIATKLKSERAYNENYHDKTELYTATKIGKFLGLSSQKLNKLLENSDIQIDTRNSEFAVNDGWVLNN